MYDQIAKALKFVHDAGIAHLDVKPENILITAVDPHMTIKLCDFGASTFIPPNGRKAKMSVTPAYWAPECRAIGKQGIPPEFELEKLDVYSYGIVVWVMITRIPYPTDCKWRINKARESGLLNVFQVCLTDTQSERGNMHSVVESFV